MFQNITTVIVEVAGAQDENVVTSTGRSGSVQVQSGSVWITCLDLPALTAHAYAWATARAEAAGYLPHTASITPLRHSSEPTLILRQTGYAQPQVYASCDRHTDAPYLEVIVASIRTRVYDRAAADSIEQAWARALLLAKPVFATAPPRLDPARADQLAGRQAIRRPGPPPAPSQAPPGTGARVTTTRAPTGRYPHGPASVHRPRRRPRQPAPAPRRCQSSHRTTERTTP
ncbi:hypothetical protein [Cumulibacter manganitolerans]|uniref:hypothetical protein n=1 Tax=Cumulibacter manganitolerans TaxID=1884992 RepID=UPI001296EDEE|nr:hypothetical protein [Cumulibacter manganitolerans]